MKRYKLNIRKIFTVCLAVLFGLGGGAVLGQNIDPFDDGSQYAWGENVGWINFEPLFGPGVTVTDSALSGLAWGENIGWIHLNPPFGGIINDGLGHLSGYAWGENVGWISFSCRNTFSCGTVAYRVTVEPDTGNFSGYAWGENIGWINFAPTGAGVKTSWTPAQTRSARPPRPDRPPRPSR